MYILGKISRRIKWLFSKEFINELWLSRKELKLIKENYNMSFCKKKVPTIAIFCLDGRTYRCGFADRIKGIISCYAFAKAIDVPFRIEHVVPFDIADYFEPNSYDWHLKDGEKTNSLFYANPVFFVARMGTISRRVFHLCKNRQHHLYTNINYIGNINAKYNKNYVFGELFSELFKPTSRLERMINEQKTRLGGKGYVSVSYRFMQLMGDFKDCRGDVLSEQDRKELIKRSLIVAKSLHEKEQKTILVTSDSQTFINAASKLDFVYVIPGAIGHIGYSKGNEVVDKMFLDFCLISQADHVYMAYSGKMYRSGFAKTAALSRNTPYTEIAF